MDKLPLKGKSQCIVMQQLAGLVTPATYQIPPCYPVQRRVRNAFVRYPGTPPQTISFEGQMESVAGCALSMRITSLFDSALNETAGFVKVQCKFRPVLRRAFGHSP